MNTKSATSKSAKTKEAILNAAKHLFIEKGFAATSMREIATAANVTQSLIHHHFDSKDNIWKEVKIAILRQAGVENDFDVEVDPQQDLRSCLEKVLRARINLYEANPELVRLMAWQELDSKQQNVQLSGGTKASPEKWIIFFKNLKKHKKIRSSIDEGMAAMLMYGAISVLQRPFLLDPPLIAEDYLQFVLDNLTKSFS